LIFRVQNDAWTKGPTSARHFSKAARRALRTLIDICCFIFSVVAINSIRAGGSAPSPALSISENNMREESVLSNRPRRDVLIIPRAVDGDVIHFSILLIALLERKSRQKPFREQKN